VRCSDVSSYSGITEMGGRLENLSQRPEGRLFVSLLPLPCWNSFQRSAFSYQSSLLGRTWAFNSKLTCRRTLERGL